MYRLNCLQPCYGWIHAGYKQFKPIVPFFLAVIIICISGDHGSDLDNKHVHVLTFYRFFHNIWCHIQILDRASQHSRGKILFLICLWRIPITEYRTGSDHQCIDRILFFRVILCPCLCVTLIRSGKLSDLRYRI